MLTLAAALAAVGAAVAAAKAIERQQKEAEEQKVRIPVRAEEPRIERRHRD
jgi:hypothetical protein